MFGERYCATRERLSELLRGIVALAEESGTDLDGHPPVSEIQASLGQPFLFMVSGEVNAGKSTLLNGLFGHDLCRVNVLPETDRVYWYRHGSPERDVQASPLLVECYRPLPFLRNFQLVDTPGTNASNQDHVAITDGLQVAADLLLFVFPIANPWGAATWDVISRLPASALDRVVFIIQQADQRQANDIAVILGHMTDLAHKRLGLAPPIFAVSGKLACEAHNSAAGSAAHLHASGFTALIDHIDRHVCQSSARRRALATWHSQAAATLRAVEDRIEEQSRDINAQHHFIQQLEREIDSIREQFVTRLPRHLAGVAEVFESEGTWVTRRLQRSLRAAPSMTRLFTGDRTGPTMESIFIERLQAAVEAVAEQDGAAVVDACHAHWQDLGQRVRTAIHVDLQATTPIATLLADARQRFVQRLGSAARQGIGNLKVRNRLDKDLRRRNRALKSFVFMTLVLTIAGASCGALGVPWLPAIFCGLAGLFLSGGVLAAWSTRKAISRDFQQRLLATCGTFASTLLADYEEALRIVFWDYAASLDHVRAHLARESLAIDPRLRRWQELFLTLKAIEQDL